MCEICVSLCIVLFRDFLARRIPFRELRGSFMEVVEHWDSLLELPVQTREGANVETFTGGCVEVELHRDRTLRNRFALMALIVNCDEHKGVRKRVTKMERGERKKRWEKDSKREKGKTKQEKKGG